MIPFLKTDSVGFTRLYVDGVPFPILGGELHNSSFSDPEYLRRQVFPEIRGLHLNTILAPISWEEIEPEEGKFDFSLLRSLLEQCRAENLHVVLLWFGLWKNGESFYTPQWVKRDAKRFFRTRYPNGELSQTVSPFCEAGIAADAAAFVQLMRFLKIEDETNTVILVQVENEVGILGADRDYSEEANRVYSASVPWSVSKLYHVCGTWQEALGADAAEMMMAWKYASAIEEIASAGKAEKPLPMYVNAWLEQHPARAGIYPSGGPVARCIPMWKAAAPTLDFISPDVYEPAFGAVCRDYSLPGNPLFIPEAARNAQCISRMLYAFGAHHALGFSPFGVEEIRSAGQNSMQEAQLRELNIMAEAFDASHTVQYLPDTYQAIREIYPILGNCIGYIRENPYDRGKILELEDFAVQLDYLPGITGSGGIVLPERNGFIILGCNTRFSLLPPKGRNGRIEILRFEEGSFENGLWKKGRTLNGDERWDMTLPEKPTARRMLIQYLPEQEEAT